MSRNVRHNFTNNLSTLKSTRVKIT